MLSIDSQESRIALRCYRWALLRDLPNNTKPADQLRVLDEEIGEYEAANTEEATRLEAADIVISLCMYLLSVNKWDLVHAALSLEHYWIGALDLPSPQNGDNIYLPNLLDEGLYDAVMEKLDIIDQRTGKFIDGKFVKDE